MRTQVAGRGHQLRAWTLAVLVLALGLLAGGGHAWAAPVVGTALPVSGTVTLTAMACPTANLCVAVGRNGSNGVVVPVTVSGSTVSAGTVATVAGTTNLRGVACPTATLCLAVGYDDNGVVVPVTVSGSTVSAGTSRAVSDTDALYGITCPTASLCLAVGFGSGIGRVVPLTLSGSIVTIGTPQTVSGTTSFYGVACPTATLCVAVGAYSGSSVVAPVTVSGSTVSAGTPQTPSGADDLTGVACPTATLCLAVGYYSPGEGVVVPVTVSGSTVSAGTGVVIAGTGIQNGVTCPGATLCLVAGSNGSGGALLSVTTNSSPITALAIQPASGTDELNGVACPPTTTLCLAVGFNDTNGVVVPITEPVGTTTQLTASQNPSLAGQPVTFTASVSCAASPDGGTVSFEDVSTSPSTPLGSAPVSGGVAVFKISSLSVGAHSIVAVYGGNANCAGSTSNALARTVLAPQGGVTLSSSRNPSNLNQAVTFTATAACFTAGETIAFLDGQTTIGTGRLNAHGVATLTTSSLSGGRHLITASYPGDGHCSAAMSAPLTQTVFGFGLG